MFIYIPEAFIKTQLSIFLIKQINLFHIANKSTKT